MLGTILNHLGLISCWGTTTGSAQSPWSILWTLMATLLPRPCWVWLFMQSLHSFVKNGAPTGTFIPPAEWEYSHNSVGCSYHCFFRSSDGTFTIWLQDQPVSFSAEVAPCLQLTADVLHQPLPLTITSQSFFLHHSKVLVTCLPVHHDEQRVCIFCPVFSFMQKKSRATRGTWPCSSFSPWDLCLWAALRPVARTHTSHESRYGRCSSALSFAGQLRFAQPPGHYPFFRVQTTMCWSCFHRNHILAQAAIVHTWFVLSKWTEPVFQCRLFLSTPRCSSWSSMSSTSAASSFMLWSSSIILSAGCPVRKGFKLTGLAGCLTAVIDCMFLRPPATCLAAKNLLTDTNGQFPQTNHLLDPRHLSARLVLDIASLFIKRRLCCLHWWFF